MSAANNPPKETVEIPGFDGFYRIGNDGCVWSCRKRGHIPNQRGPWKIKSDSRERVKPGYYRRIIQLCKPENPKTFKVHHLVAEAFIGPRPNGMQCLHKDGNGENNNARNLSGGTQSENEKDKIEHGKSNRGNQCSGRAKLSPKDVSKIRELYKSQSYDYSHIAKMFNVSETNIRSICHRNSWRYL